MRTDGMKVLIEIDIPDLGPEIRKAREEAGLSPTEAAAASGMSMPNLYRIEKEDAKGVPLTTLARLSKTVNLDLSDRIVKAVQALVEVA